VVNERADPTARQAWGDRMASRALALVVAALAITGAAWAMSAPNVARGKPVRMSSQRPYFGPRSAGVSPEGAVDGQLPSAFDVLTNTEASPWLVVDLLAPHRLSKVVVYNRDDCCWGIRDLPMVIEGSIDDVEYTELGRRRRPFTQTAPWVLRLGSATARYVRVRVDASAGEIALSEVEVYGRPAAGGGP
jgi:hypothetical protein